MPWAFARDGFPAYQLLHRTIGSPDRLANLQKYPDSARVYLPNGKPPALGSLFTQPDLARTLTLMVEAEQRALGQGQSRGSRSAGRPRCVLQGRCGPPHGAGLARPRWAVHL